MEGWTATARQVLEQQDSELQGMTVDSDVSESDRPQPRNRWTVRTLVLGAAFGLAALAAIAVAYAPWTSSVGQPLDRSIEGGHAIVLTDDQPEALDSRGSAGARASIAGTAMLHVDDLNTFEGKAAASPTCQIPCGGGGGTCSSALADLLDGSTGSMPPGSDPSCFGAQELVKQQCPLCSCCGDMCAVETKLGAAPPGCLNPYTVPIDLFDLNSSHPDMEQSTISGHCPGLVDPVLAPDFTPVLSGNPQSGKCANAITSASSFNDWYHNTANSFPVSSEITLCQDPNSNNFFVYDNTSYFAMDGRGWDERMPGEPDHNYHFTMHLHNYFTMQGGEVFTFRGDDDVWVFFSKCDRATGQCEPSKLGIDLGGVHTPLEQTVDLEKLGFNKDDYIRMDFFWAERHTELSNLRIVTNIVFDTETTTTSGTSTTATTTTKTTVTATTTTITGTTTTNTDTETTVTRTETTTTATTTTVTTTTVTTTTVTTTTTTLTTTSMTATSVTTTTTVTTTTLGPTTTPSVGPSAAPTMSPTTTPDSCEEGCDGMTCAAKLLEILDESGSGSSPPITVPEAVLILIKMCPNCASCDPSGVCPSIVGPANR